MTKNILIIGAGPAGLAAGCYAQMNGYQSQIFELHDLPGGLCTAWERKGYIFDGCLHYLFGCAPGRPFHQVWDELDILDNMTFIHHDEFIRIQASDGRTLIVYADPDRLEAHMKELSPRDAGLIEDFVDGIRHFLNFDLAALQATPRDLMTPDDWRIFGEKMMPYTLPLARWGILSARDFAARFHDPFLQRAIPEMFAWDEIPVMAGQMVLAYMHNHNAGFPQGASLQFARALEQRYLALGGQIHYKSQVEKILTQAVPGERKHDRATGVRLYNDNIHSGDFVISAADARGTVFDMLGGKYLNRQLRQMFDGHLPIRSQVQVSIGVNRDLSAEPHWVAYLLDEPLLIAGEERDAIGVKHYCFDPTLAPAGKSAVEIMLSSSYGYWQRIYGRKLYDTEQNQIADILIDQVLEKLYPGFRAQIEVVDVATPLSYERYTGNWFGATTGFLLTKESMPMLVTGVSKTLPGLENLYLAGHWVEPGGLVPVAAMSGRNAVHLICHADGKAFQPGGE